MAFNYLHDNDFDINLDKNNFITPFDLQNLTKDIKSGKLIKIDDDFIMKAAKLSGENVYNSIAIASYMARILSDQNKVLSEEDIIGDLGEYPLHGDTPFEPKREEKLIEERAADLETYLKQMKLAKQNKGYVDQRLAHSPLLSKMSNLIVKMHMKTNGIRDKRFREVEMNSVLDILTDAYSTFYSVSFISNKESKFINKKIRIISSKDERLKGILPILTLGRKMNCIGPELHLEYCLYLSEIGSMVGGWLNSLYRVLKEYNSFDKIGEIV